MKQQAPIKIHMSKIQMEFDQGDFLVKFWLEPWLLEFNNWTLYEYDFDESLKKILESLISVYLFENSNIISTLVYQIRS